ncbi:DUF5684 domain-containing protein [Microbacterium rhizomatis]|uniref:FHA domain-containing protein n=1 Tax=Microbacterium rhizomatis TaxID=1631477 RepID=A0A5J5J2F4_9MICO|nr:DUF5684 domain-containing protein [Microbacterium rhizomatis]KAA9107849.1 FHA domain-containing protein [Microbacterium rhizomatis]
MNVSSGSGGSIAIWLIAVALSVVLYAWAALALSALFRKVGTPAWQAWVPFLNVFVVLELGGVSGWFVLLALIPVLGWFGLWVVVVLAAHRISAAFGFGGGMTVLAAVLFPVWASVLGFGSARWLKAPAHAAGLQQPDRSSMPVAGRTGSPAHIEAPDPFLSPDASGPPRSAPSAAPTASTLSPAATPSGPAAQVWPVWEPERASSPLEEDLEDLEVSAVAPGDVPPYSATASASGSSSASASAPVPRGDDDSFDSMERWDGVASTATDGSRPSDGSNAHVPGPRAASTSSAPDAAPPVLLPSSTPSPAVSAVPAVVTRTPFTPPPPRPQALPQALSQTPPQALSQTPPQAPLRDGAEAEPWAPRRSQVPAADELDDTSGEVSAVIGAPYAGMPRSALSSVSALHARPEDPDDDDEFGETMITRRRRARWSLVPTSGAPIALTGDVVTLGRSPAGDRAFPRAQLVTIPDATRTVSKTHARLELRGDSWFVTDLGSTNGVLLVTLMGTEIEAAPGVELAAEERFFLGDVEVRLRRNDV